MIQSAVISVCVGVSSAALATPISFALFIAGGRVIQNLKERIAHRWKTAALQEGWHLSAEGFVDGNLTELSFAMSPKNFPLTDWGFRMRMDLRGIPHIVVSDPLSGKSTRMWGYSDRKLDRAFNYLVREACRPTPAE